LVYGYVGDILNGNMLLRLMVLLLILKLVAVAVSYTNCGIASNKGYCKDQFTELTEHQLAGEKPENVEMAPLSVEMLAS
jgi:hypothetical protein